MDTKKLRQKILDLAIHGKLVPQDPNDEPASVLLERIRKEKEQLIKEGKIKAPKKSKSAGDTSHYPKEGPWELPRGWVWCHLSDLASFAGGKTPSMDNKDFWKNGKHLWITSKDMKSRYLVDSQMKISDTAVREMTVFHPGTILMVNRSGILRRTLPLAILNAEATINQDIKAIVPYLLCISPYLYYAILSQESFILSEYKKAGTTVDNINFDKFISLLIPLPPQKEQDRIVSSINQYFAIIENIDSNQKDLNTSLEAAKAKTLDLAIRGKLVPQDPNEEPAIELLKRINPDFKPSDNLHYETQQLYTLPNGWEWCSVKDYTKKVTDYVASGSFASLKENVKYYKKPNYAILVKTKDFANNFTEDLTYTDKRGYDYLENSHLHGGELLFSNVGSVGKVFKVPKLNARMTLAPNAIMVKFHQENQSEWFERVFLSPFGQESLRTIASATAIMKFNKTDFGKLLIPVPPIDEQKRIIKLLDALLYQLDCINGMEKSPNS